MASPKYRAVIFDDFANNCPYFTSNTPVNNGYGCNHSKQEEKEDGHGKCYCFSCPLGFEITQEDWDEKESHNSIDWDGTTRDDIDEGEYLAVETDREQEDSIKDDINLALANYNGWMNRYTQ